jgi:hypothetical protein
MASLKNPQLQIPGGFQMWVPELRWAAPKGLSIQQIATGLIAARQANPAITRQRGWSTDLATVMQEVEAYQVQICQAYGWHSYITNDPSPPPRPFVQASAKTTPLGRGVKNAVAGVATISEMFGKAGPVDAALAESRAAVCAKCPLNDKVATWEDFFTVPAANWIRKALGVVKDLELKTSHDGELGVCRACDCPMKLKVWAKLEHILEHIPAESKAALDTGCWIRSEESQP